MALVGAHDAPVRLATANKRTPAKPADRSGAILEFWTKQTKGRVSVVVYARTLIAPACESLPIKASVDRLSCGPLSSKVNAHTSTASNPRSWPATSQLLLPGKALPRSQDSQRGAKPKLSLRQVIDALRASGGIRLKAARILGCSPIDHFYIDRYPAIANAENEIRETWLDFAETILIKSLTRDDKPGLQLGAAKYYLTKKGHDRGYATSRKARKGLAGEYDLSRLSQEEQGILRALLQGEVVIDLRFVRRLRSVAGQCRGSAEGQFF